MSLIFYSLFFKLDRLCLLSVFISLLAPPPSYQSLFGQVQQAGKQCNKMAQLARHLLLLALGTVGMSVLLAGTVFIPFTMILIGISHMNDCPAEPIPLFLFVGGLVWLSRNIHNVFSKCSFNSSLLAAASSNRTERSASSSARSNARNDLNINRSACAFDCESNVNELGADQTESNNLNNTDCDLHLPSASRTYTCSINTNHEQLLSSSARAASAASDRPTPANRRQTMLHVFWLFWFVAGCAMVYRLFPPEYVDKSKPNYCDQSVYLFAFWLVTSVFIVFGLFVSCLCCVSIAALFSSPAARQRLSAGA